MKAKSHLMSGSVLPLSILLCALCSGGCGRSEATLEEGTTLLARAGGLAKVNAEAAQIFNRFGTNTTMSLFDADLTEFPAIRALGNSVILGESGPGFPPHLRIRYGTHWRSKFFLIFDGDNGTNFTRSLPSIQICSNVFLLK